MLLWRTGLSPRMLWLKNTFTSFQVNVNVNWPSQTSPVIAANGPSIAVKCCDRTRSLWLEAV